MIQKITRIFRLFLICFLFCGNPLSEKLLARDRLEAFERISIGLDYLSNINQNIFHNYWQPQGGIEISARFPFYAGMLRGGLHLVPYQARKNTDVDFISQFYFVGWGADLPVFAQLMWQNGLRIGPYRMDFDDEQINITQRTESELAVGISSAFIYRLSTNWQIRSGVDYIKVFTKKRLELVFISAGLCFEFETPGWLQDFLK